jgi:glutamate-1-semialdehyde aminotransferase
MRHYTRSSEYLERALKVIPLATCTLSKGYRYFPQGAWPVFLDRADGCLVWDVDGNMFIDYIMSLCPITIGYNDPIINLAISRQLLEGIVFSLPSPLEFKLAEKLTEIIPGVEMVRFLKTGSEADQAAIRAARAFTGRNHIAFRGYHGWHSWYAVQSDRPKGIPKEEGQYMHEFQYNNLDSLRGVFDSYPSQIACEPVIIEHPLPGFLEGVKELCHKNGALLIFDEVVTGFRWTLGGASQYFGVTADLVTFGKGMGNGMPIAAVGGRRDVMREFEDIMVSSTFGGECLSLAASIATINEMQKMRTIDKIWQRGQVLMDGLRGLGLEVSGYPCRPAITTQFSTEEKSLLLELMAQRGVLIHSNLVMNLCYAHSMNDIRHTIEVFRVCLATMKKQGVKASAILLQPAFKRL